MISEQAKQLMQRTVVWENHACMPLRPGDVSFLPQLERVRKAGINLVALNVSFDLAEPHDAFLMLATFRHWIGQQGGLEVSGGRGGECVANLCGRNCH